MASHIRSPFERKIKEIENVSGALQVDSNLTGENSFCGNALCGIKIFIQVDLGRYCL